MPMRQNCKFFSSRTYPSGDTVRKCDLDLAPEAPWRCPEDCPSFTPRLADVNWKHGSLIIPPAPEEPDSLDSDDSVAQLLQNAEEIVRQAGPDIIAEYEKERALERKKELDSKRSSFRERLKKFGSWFKRSEPKNKPDDKDN